MDLGAASLPAVPGPREAVGYGGRRFLEWLCPQQSTKPRSPPVAPCADTALHPPWSGGGPGLGQRRCSHRCPDSRKPQSGPSQGQASRCLETRHQGNNGQMAKNGRGSLLSLGGAVLPQLGPGWLSLVIPPSVSKCPHAHQPFQKAVCPRPGEGPASLR